MQQLLSEWMTGASDACEKNFPSVCRSSALIQFAFVLLLILLSSTIELSVFARILLATATFAVARRFSEIAAKYIDTLSQWI